ncbi:HAD-IB family hydrolase [Shewanella sp. KX20019]|uniref:HAD-IB family hydrolase n=1 Tax=Shewanella sp. KX20019 TaxID=2803864 RepID=UPI0019274379|nr:HAD-IB family hydrolase [Shewanella sp. KX20019]QQX81339.1 HAD-IB family hydrolase [Shewanella sp. KX20019]
MKLALFDFDGTLTRHDMYTRFILYSASPVRLVLGSIFLSPLYALYRLRIIPARKLRPLVSYCAFVGRDKAVITTLGKQYALNVIPLSIRPEMLAALKRHQAEGADVVLVSASLDLYLRPWCESMGITLICSEMSVKRGRYSGFYVSGDCSCEMKATKVQTQFTLSDYAEVFAYGDTDEDLAMLAIADHAFMNGIKHGSN